MQSQQIVTIRLNNNTNQEFSKLFEFVGENNLETTAENWLTVTSSVESLFSLAIDLSDFDEQKQLQQSLKGLLGEIAQHFPQVPVLLLGVAKESFQPEIQKSPELYHQVVALLPQNCQYPEMISALHLCQLCQKAESVSLTPGGYTKSFRSMVGQSAKMAQVRKLIEQVSTTEANVLIMGESGTGKEVVARNLHYLSHRKDAPFVPVNCGAIPPDLLESELFGHEKGAFTGAISARQGRFELAQGGTLFLDEIGDMPMPMQVKLLRVIQERTFERVGGTKVLKADVRIVAATHRDLESAVAKGDFREDLFYRLNVFPIEVPPLRERIEDLPLLINELATRLQNEGRKGIRFTLNAIQSLSQHPWPGNVRELANLVERMAILLPFGVADVSDLPAKYVQSHNESKNLPPLVQEMLQQKPIESQPATLPEEGIQLKQYLADLEKNFIVQSLEMNDGVVARAADALGMRRTTLVEKMKKYDLGKDA